MYTTKKNWPLPAANFRSNFIGKTIWSNLIIDYFHRTLLERSGSVSTKTPKRKEKGGGDPRRNSFSIPWTHNSVHSHFCSWSEVTAWMKSLHKQFQFSLWNETGQRKEDSEERARQAGNPKTINPLLGFIAHPHHLSLLKSDTPGNTTKQSGAAAAQLSRYIGSFTSLFVDRTQHCFHCWDVNQPMSSQCGLRLWNTPFHFVLRGDQKKEVKEWEGMNRPSPAQLWDRGAASKRASPSRQEWTAGTSTWTGQDPRWEPEPEATAPEQPAGSVQTWAPPCPAGRQLSNQVTSSWRPNPAQGLSSFPGWMLLLEFWRILFWKTGGVASPLARGQLECQASVMNIHQVLDEGRDLNYQVKKYLLKLQHILCWHGSGKCHREAPFPVQSVGCLSILFMPVISVL